LANAYYLAPVLDPWVMDHQVPTLRQNNAGDSVVRLPPRVLLSALSAALKWPAFELVDEEEEGGQANSDNLPELSADVAFQMDIGVYLMDGVTGFRGNNLGESLAWEEALGDCRAPFVEPGEGSPDWIDALVAEAPKDATMEAAVSALKDRLLSRPDLSDEMERLLLERLMGVPLTTPLLEVEDAGGALRRVCSAMIASADFLLAGAPGPPAVGSSSSAWVPSDMSSTSLCDALRKGLFAPDQASCTPDGRLELSLE
jgi:hypothetical protein